MFQRIPPPSSAQLGVLLLAAALGVLGCWPGELDPVAELAWLALLAPAAGACCGASGVALFPFGLAVPGVWLVFLVLADARSPRDLPTPLWAAAAVAGLLALGHALGRVVRARPVALAGVLLLVGCLLVGLSVGCGLSASDASLARAHPGLAGVLFDLSPLTLVFDCAGWDWAHANREVYARAGVEWFQRRPYPGILAGPGVLVVGCTLSWFASWPNRGR